MKSFASMISLMFSRHEIQSADSKRVCSEFSWLQDSNFVPVFIDSLFVILTLGSGAEG